MVDLAHEIGKPPSEIENDAYRLAKKYRVRIGTKTIYKGKDLHDVYGKSQEHNLPDFEF